jgi:hypothetical protein
LLPVTDLNGNTEHLTNIRGLKRTRKVNGDRTVGFFVVPDKTNAHSFPLVEAESSVEFDGEDYVIKRLYERNAGHKSIKQAESEHRFFVDMRSTHEHGIRNGSQTFESVLSFIFGNTPYTYNLIDPFSAETFEDFGNESKLALFKTALERYGAEFYIVDNTVFIKSEIGSKTDFQYRYGHNVKAINVQRDTDNLATIIRGYGGEADKDGNYPLQVEYRSPNIDVFGEIEAPPVYNADIIVESEMLALLEKTIIDEPQLSITIDFADLRASGYLYNAPNEGDYGFIIYEPMDIDIEARIIEVVEEFDADFTVIKTSVTLSNIKQNLSDVMTRFSKTTKSVNRILRGQQKLPYNVLDDAVQLATEALQSAQTELEFDNGIIARSKVDPNVLVLLNSAGVGISTDGGATFTTAMTGNGIVADVITAGTMSFNRASGGTLTLGGTDNGYGRLIVLDANGESIADLDAERGGFDKLHVVDFTSPTVTNYSAENITLYVEAGGNGDDSNDGASSTTPLRSLAEVFRRISKHYDGTATINLLNTYTFYENLNVTGYGGSGTIKILANNTTVSGNSLISNCSARIEIDNLKLNGKGGYSTMSIRACPSVRVRYSTIYGGGSDWCVDVLHGSFLEIVDCEIYEASRCIRAGYGATVMNINTKGLGSGNGMYAYGGYITGTGTCPDGTNSTLASFAGGQIFGSFTADAGAATPPPSPETTSTWDTTASKSWRDNWGWRTDNSDVYQGEYDGYGHHRGYWFFGNTPRDTVVGKTIKQIRVYVKRKGSGGTSGTVNAIIRGHSYASQPSGTPTFVGGLSGTSDSVGFKWGEGKWVTLPSSFHAMFEDGTAYGIGIYTSSTSNGNYMIFEPSAKLEITYE